MLIFVATAQRKFRSVDLLGLFYITCKILHKLLARTEAGAMHHILESMKNYAIVYYL